MPLHVVIALLAAAAAAAAPVDLSSPTHFDRPGGHAAHAAASAAPAPGGGAPSNGTAAVVTVPLTNFRNAMYYGEVRIGTPAQTLRVMFATGSADTWVPTTRCASKTCRGHSRFAEAYSKTLGGGGAADVNLTYSLGSISGRVARDTVRVGGAEAAGAPFVGVSSLGHKFQSQYRWLPFDGIVGLGYRGASVSRQQPLFDALMAGGALKRNVFSLYLTQSPGAAGSVLTLGGTDPRLHLDELAFFPVERPHVFWAVNVSRIALQESLTAAASPIDRRLLVSLCAPEQHHKGCRAVVDSGTSLISGPSAAIRRLAEHIRVDPSCRGVDALPTLSFQFYGRTFSLHPADYVIRVPVDVGAEGGAGDGAAEEACFLGLESQDFPEQMGPMWVLGNVFLRKFYTVFDRDADMIGFAMARPV